MTTVASKLTSSQSHELIRLLEIVEGIHASRERLRELNPELPPGSPLDVHVPQKHLGGAAVWKTLQQKGMVHTLTLSGPRGGRYYSHGLTDVGWARARRLRDTRRAKMDEGLEQGREARRNGYEPHPPSWSNGAHRDGWMIGWHELDRQIRTGGVA